MSKANLDKIVSIRMALSVADDLAMWQCSGCLGMFLGRWRRECPACHRMDHWSGSVDPETVDDAAVARAIECARERIAKLCAAVGVPVPGEAARLERLAIVGTIEGLETLHAEKAASTSDLMERYRHHAAQAALGALCITLKGAFRDAR